MSQLTLLKKINYHAADMHYCERLGTHFPSLISIFIYHLLFIFIGF